jgi:glycosyltransferase involved in cell wall biosynthesis
MTVHLVEPIGRGGVYQHSTAIATALDTAGIKVVLHTATDAEFWPELDVCPCVDWKRDHKRGLIRQVRRGAAYLLVTLPHLIRTVRRGDVLHFQGLYKAGLGALTIGALHAKGVRVVFSPHNTFSRSNSAIDRVALRLGLHVADAVIVHSSEDAKRISSRRAGVRVSPLIQEMRPVDPALIGEWRKTWRAESVALVAGQLRPDKGLPEAVTAAASWGPNVRLAIVGEDCGGVSEAKAVADRLGVNASWTVEYLTLERFLAALRAADVVLCPYPRASQSGVLALARAVGTPTVATAVGGLCEYAMRVVPPGDPVALGEAVMSVSGRREPPDPTSTRCAVTVHVDAYRLSSPMSVAGGLT